MISSCSSNTKHSKGNTSTDFGIPTSSSSSSISNIKRAIKSGVLELSLSITYCNDINKSSRTYYKFIDKVI